MNRKIRNKVNGKTITQYSRWDGVNYVFLAINKYWEVVSKPTLSN